MKKLITICLIALMSLTGCKKTLQLKTKHVVSFSNVQPAQIEVYINNIRVDNTKEHKVLEGDNIRCKYWPKMTFDSVLVDEVYIGIPIYEKCGIQIYLDKKLVQEKKYDINAIDLFYPVK